MKGFLAGAMLVASAGLACADTYIMGPGRWTCGQAITAWQGRPIDKGQLAGWIMGYWSAATATREKAFVDAVEKAGAVKIVEATLSACRQAGPDVPLYKVTQGMIANTR